MKYKGLLVGVAFIATAVLVVVGIYTYKHFNQPIISANIRDKLTSAVYLVKASNTSIDKSSVKYDGSLQQLSYIAKYGKQEVVISMQPAPDVFADVPAYFDKWITSTGAYTHFESPNGTVYLASNPNYGAKTVAIMYANKTLLFAKPNGELSLDQWKQFFRTLKLQT